MTVSLDSYWRSPNITGDSANTTCTPTGDIIGVVMSVGTAGASQDSPPFLWYGGLPLRKVKFANDYAGELSTQTFFVLDRDVPQGAQTATWVLSNGSMNGRFGQTWVGHVWLIAGDGDGIKVVAADSVAGAGADLPANPTLDLDSGSDTALRIAGLICGHDSTGSHAFMAGMTTDNTDDWGAQTGRYGHETTPSSGDPTIGVTMAAEDGVLIGLAVTDGGYDRSVPAFMFWNGPSGVTSEADKTILTKALHRQAKMLLVIAVNVSNSDDILDSVEWDGVAMTELRNVSYAGRRVWSFYLSDPAWASGTAKSLVFKHTAAGSASEWTHSWVAFMDGPGPADIADEFSHVLTSGTTYNASVGVTGRRTLSFGAGWYEFASYDFWCASGSGSNWEADSGGLANGACQYALGWDMGSYSSNAWLVHARDGTGSAGLTNGNTNRDVNECVITVGFTSGARRHRVFLLG